LLAVLLFCLEVKTIFKISFSSVKQKTKFRITF